MHSDQEKEKYMINYSTLRSKTLIKLKNHTTPMLTKSSSVLKCCVERGAVKAQRYIFFNHRKYGTIRETLLQRITSAMAGHDRIAGI